MEARARIYLDVDTNAVAHKLWIENRGRTQSTSPKARKLLSLFAIRARLRLLLDQVQLGAIMDDEVGDSDAAHR
jgi:hypothetical protein